jgi:hypothetical protein
MAARRWLGVLVAAGVLLVGACGDDDATSPSATSAASTTTSIAGGSTTTSTVVATTTTPPVTTTVAFPSVATLQEAATQLASRGVRCTRLEIESEGAIGTTADDTDRALCRRDGVAPLQLFRYRDDAQRTAMRNALTTLECGDPGATRALEGRPLVLAVAPNLDVRAVSDDAVSLDDLERRNAETAKVAGAVGLSTVRPMYRCG